MKYITILREPVVESFAGFAHLDRLLTVIRFQDPAESYMVRTFYFVVLLMYLGKI